MNLCDRLHTKAPIYWWGKYCFRYMGEVREGKSALVWQVAERFSRRFGELRGRDADKIYARLSRKYCVHPGSASVLRSLEFGHEGRDHIAHPAGPAQLDKDARWQVRLQEWADQATVKAVSKATDQAEGRYCIADSAKSPCRICGRPTAHVDVLGGKELRCDSSGQSGKEVCAHTRCQALLELFPKAFNSRKYYEYPLILVIQEVAKNENNYENKRRLEKHFVRRTRQFRQRED